ncbi:MAG: Tll0287-like domain-containing protein [Gammaproteobacteria bacterium]
MKSKKLAAYAAALAAASLLALSARGGEEETASITLKQMADALHTVMEADRTVYAKEIVNRLQYEENVIKASEHWKDDKALPLPAQFLRLGAELVAEKTESFSYALLSLWPVNKQNAPVTKSEKTGLQHVVDHPDENYYGSEEFGGTRYFTAVYPDKAVAEACVECHNHHKDSPRRDFKLNDVMGGIVIRIPQKGG